jgi:hypothetical protein
MTTEKVAQPTFPTKHTRRGKQESTWPRQNIVLTFLQDVAQSTTTAKDMTMTLSLVLEKTAGFMGWPLAHAYVWSEEMAAYISSGIWFAQDQTAFQQFRQLTAQW